MRFSTKFSTVSRFSTASLGFAPSRLLGLAISIHFGLITGCSSNSSPTSQAPSAQGSSGETVAIAVTQIVEHPSLDAVRDGLKAELEAQGYREGENLVWDWQSAQGNPSTAAQIAQKFAGDEPDVIVAISTPSAQAAASATQDIPIVFSAVTDPVSAKLVATAEAPGANVTGVSDLTPVAEHLALIQRILPEASRVGVVYNAGESNSVSLVALLQEAAADQGITLEEATANNSAGVSTAVESLVDKVDAIYVPTDNTVASALEAVLQVGIDNQLPIFAGDNDSVARGAIASLSFDYGAIGQDTGAIVTQILQGDKPSNLPVVYPTDLELVVNPKAAEQMGVEVPADMLSEATTLIE